MKRLLILAALLVGASTAAADPAAPVVHFPIVPAPAPIPAPGASVTLAKDQLYVFSSNTKLIVAASPDGLVKISEDTGPLTVKAKFVDGDGTYQSRKITDKYVYTAEAVRSGTVELIVIADGTTDVLRHTIEVGGVTPPIPTPPTPPAPPTPPITPVATGPLWVVAVIDNSARTPAMTAVLADTALEKRITSAGNHWKVYDPNAPDSPVNSPAWKPFIDEAGGVPALIILDKTGKKLKAVRFPATSAAIDQLIKDVEGK